MNSFSRLAHQMTDTESPMTFPVDKCEHVPVPYLYGPAINRDPKVGNSVQETCQYGLKPGRYRQLSDGVELLSVVRFTLDR